MTPINHQLVFFDGKPNQLGSFHVSFPAYGSKNNRQKKKRKKGGKQRKKKEDKKKKKKKGGKRGEGKKHKQTNKKQTQEEKEKKGRLKAAGGSQAVAVRRTLHLRVSQPRLPRSSRSAAAKTTALAVTSSRSCWDWRVWFSARNVCLCEARY